MVILRRLMQGDGCEFKVDLADIFKASLNYIERPCFKKTEKNLENFASSYFVWLAFFSLFLSPYFLLSFPPFLFFSLLPCLPFFLPFLIILCNTLNTNRKNGDPFFVLDYKGQAFSFSLLSVMLSTNLPFGLIASV